MADAFVADSMMPEPQNAWASYQHRTTDTVEHALGRLETEERLDPATNRMELVTHWFPPSESLDTLNVDRATLEPRDESFRSKRLTYAYRYDRSRVTGTIQHGDSLPRAIAHDFLEPVYAFNEVDQLVRALRFRAAAQVVLPFFSEADAALEHDTLAVLRDTVVQAAEAWIVQFADPVIVRRYIVDARSRRILESSITQRRSGTRFRLARLRPHDR